MPKTPRAQIDDVLRERKVTLVDFAHFRRLDFSLLHHLYDGGYPGHGDHPPELRKIGEAIGADPQEWADMLGAGFAKLTPEDARDSLKARLWSYLVRNGLTAEAAGERHQTTAFVIAAALRNGAPTRALRQSTLLAAIGIDSAALPYDLRRRSATNPAIVELFERVLRRNPKLTRLAIREAVGCGKETVAMLMRGQVPFALKPIFVPSLARVLGEPVEDVAHHLAMSWRRTSGPPTAGSLRYLIIRHCFIHGVPLETLAIQADVGVQCIPGIFDGAFPNGETLQKIRAILQPKPEEWHRALSSQATRNMVDSESYLSLASAGVKPLNDLILEAAAAQKIDPYAWGSQFGIPVRSMRGILERAYLVRSADTRVALVRALGLEQHSFLVACRLMTERYKPDHRGFGHITATTGIQEHFLRLIRDQGVTLEELARSLAISGKTAERLVKLGLGSLKPHILERVRQYLGLSPHAFQQQMRVIDDGDIEDDDELRLLAGYRRLREDRKAQLLGMIGRLQVESRPLTLVYRDGAQRPATPAQA